MKRTPKITSITEDGDGLIKNRQMVLNSDYTGGDVYLVKGVMPEGSVVPVHIHALEDEIFHVLEGEVELVLGDEILHGKSGDIIYLPRNIKHGIRTLGSETAVVLNYVLPGKNFESFFNRLKALGLTIKDEKVKDIALEYQITFI